MQNQPKGVVKVLSLMDFIISSKNGSENIAAIDNSIVSYAPELEIDLFLPADCSRASNKDQIVEGRTYTRIAESFRRRRFKRPKSSRYKIKGL
ncbi:hypothetical protein YC2023_024947 [Brassica napus]